MQFGISCPSVFLKILKILQKSRGLFIPKITSTKHVINWLITRNQQTLRIETNIFFTGGNYKSMSGQLQNNFVKCAMTITINRVLINKIVINIRIAMALHVQSGETLNCF